MRYQSSYYEMPVLEPLVTTILPTYLRPESLARAMDSVLSQEGVALRLLVCDNGNDEATTDLVLKRQSEDSRIMYTRHASNIGSFANFLFGLRQVETRYLSFLSDDDELLPGCLARGVAALEQEPRAACASNTMLNRTVDGVIVVESCIPAGIYQPPEGLTQIWLHGHPTWTGTVFRRQAIREVDDLDPRASPPIDLDLQLALAARYPIIVLPELGALYCHSLRAPYPISAWAAAWEHITFKVTGSPGLSQDIIETFRHSSKRRLVAMAWGAGIEGMGRDDIGEARSALAILQRLDWFRAALLRIAIRIPLFAGRILARRRSLAERQTARDRVVDVPGAGHVA